MWNMCCCSEEPNELVVLFCPAGWWQQRFLKQSECFVEEKMRFCLSLGQQTRSTDQALSSHSDNLTHQRWIQPHMTNRQIHIKYQFTALLIKALMHYSVICVTVSLFTHSSSSSSSSITPPQQQQLDSVFLTTSINYWRFSYFKFHLHSCAAARAPAERRGVGCGGSSPLGCSAATGCLAQWPQRPSANWIASPD